MDFVLNLFQGHRPLMVNARGKKVTTKDDRGNPCKTLKSKHAHTSSKRVQEQTGGMEVILGNCGHIVGFRELPTSEGLCDVSSCKSFPANLL